MSGLQITILLMVMVSAPGVALTREPVKQAIGISFYGILLGLLFFIYKAPDVALSQITVGAVALPLMILLALSKIKADEDLRKRGKKDEA